MVADPSESEQQVLDRSTSGVFAVNRDLVVTFHNSTAARLVGRDGERLVGSGLLELFPHLEGSEFERQLVRSLADQVVLEFEDFSPFAGRWLWRRFYPDVEGVTCIFGEVPVPRAAHVELRESLTRALASERRYRNLLDGMAEGVLETTVAGHLLAVNQAFAVMLGYGSPEDMLIHVVDAKALYVNAEERAAHVARVSGGSWPVGEVEMLRKDGSHVWVRAHSSPRRDVTGEVGSFQTVVEDLTERSFSERELRHVTERIEDRERALLAESVHDDPIQLIVASLLRIEALQKLLPPAQVEAMDQIADLLGQAVERLRQLITALTPPDLTEGLGEALRQAVAGIFVGTSTTIEVVGPMHVPLTPEVKIDCYRVVREALVNARKHANAQHVTIGLSPGADHVAISVADDGNGAVDFSAGPGHLGVALMRTRADLLGGHVSIESTPAVGTTVRLVVPRSTHQHESA